MNWLRMLPLILLTLMLQLELFADLPIFGVLPDIMLGLSVLVAIQAGAEQGAVVGFGAGLLYDVFLSTPLTLSAVSYALVAYAVGRLAENFADNAVAKGLSLILLMVGVASGFMLFVMIGELLGQEHLWNDRLNVIVLVGTIYTAAITSLILRPLSRWALGLQQDHAGARPLRPSSMMN